MKLFNGFVDIQMLKHVDVFVTKWFSCFIDNMKLLNFKNITNGVGQKKILSC